MKLRESGREAFKVTTNTSEQKGHQYGKEERRRIGCRRWKGGGADVEYLGSKEMCGKKVNQESVKSTAIKMMWCARQCGVPI